MPNFGAGGTREGGPGRGAAQALLTAGYTFHYVSDRLLAKMQCARGALRSAGNSWQLLLVPETQFMPLKTLNRLEVVVTNLAANRIADLDRRDPSWKKFYNTNYPARIGGNRGPDGNFSAAKWAPRASGLLGPVTLTPLSALKPK